MWEEITEKNTPLGDSLVGARFTDGHERGLRECLGNQGDEGIGNELPSEGGQCADLAWERDDKAMVSICISLHELP